MGTTGHATRVGTAHERNMALIDHPQAVGSGSPQRLYS
jgi:hypothetical protein